MIVGLHKWDHHLIPKRREVTPDLEDAFTLTDDIFHDGNEQYNGLHDGYLTALEMGLRSKLVINEHATSPLRFAGPFTRFRT